MNYNKKELIEEIKGVIIDLDYFIEINRDNEYQEALLKFKLKLKKDELFEDLNLSKKEYNKYLRSIVIRRIDQLIDFISKSNQLQLFDSETETYNKVTSEPREPNYPATEFVIPFKDYANLFKGEYSTKLFCYLVDHYHKGKDKELSNIYQWMENNKLIKIDTRQKYKEMVKKFEITTQKYSRVHPKTEYLDNDNDHSLNDLKKLFDKEIKQ
jgi:hypothetical protein